MAKTFTFALNADAESIIEKAKQHAVNTKANFTGDSEKGEFGGSGVKGEYKIAGDEIQVTIHKKPLIAPWGMVESELKNFFA